MTSEVMSETESSSLDNVKGENKSIKNLEKNPKANARH